MSRSSGAILQEEAAKLLSDVRDGCNTSQKAIDCMISGFDKVYDAFLNFLKETMQQKLSLRDGYLSLHDFNSVVESSCRGHSLFEGINTQSRMESYLADESKGQEVVLKKVVFSHRTKWRRGIPVLVPFKFGYIVPFLRQLEQLLNIKDVLECVEHPLPSEDGKYRTVTDGLMYKFHPVVHEHGTQTLAITIYVDDVEVCDPLKSKANIHNLRFFYWMLANIHPKLRSTLKAINLLAIVNAKVAKKYGNDAFLRSFINDLILLGKDGVIFNINGIKRTFYAILLFCSGDNPAVCNLGGLKETHSALRPCRQCMVTNNNLCTHFRESSSLLRKKSEHESQLKKIMKSDSSKYQESVIDVFQDGTEAPEDDPSVNYTDHPKPSVNFGVNRASILSEAPGFDVTKCLPQDVMHVVMEGVLEMLCRFLLREACFPSDPEDPRAPKPKRLTIEKLNGVIESVNLGPLEKSKPSKIDKAHILGQKLKQSASQLKSLLYLMPWLVVDYCSKETFDLLVKLIKLVSMLLSHEFRCSDLDHLQDMIEEFGTNFMVCYPQVKTLNLHFLTHLVTQIKLFGPLRQQWCFRFESMHSQFTSLVPVIRSKKNIAFSLANRYISKRNCEIMKALKTGKFLYGGDSVKGLQEIVFSSLSECEKSLACFSNLVASDIVIKVKEFVQQSSNWKEGSVITLKREPTVAFGRIHSLYLIKFEVFILFNEFQITFEERCNAFQVMGCDQQLKCIKLCDLSSPFPAVKFSFAANQAHDAKSYILPSCDLII